MTTRLKVWLIFLSMLLGRVVHSQNADQTFQKIADRLAQREGQAVSEAGNSGDLRFLPVLRRLFIENSENNGDFTIRLYIAMARLGDQEILQGLACGVEVGRPILEEHLLSRVLPQVGAVALSIYERVLTEDHYKGWILRNNKYRGDVAEDTGPATPAVIVIMQLPKLFKDPPRTYDRSPGRIWESEAAFWREWLAKLPSEAKSPPKIQINFKECVEPRMQVHLRRLERATIFRVE